MKTTMLQIFALLFLLCFILNTTKAQNDNVIQYRVTAVKSGEKSVVSVSNIVEVMPSAMVYIPNAFSPNGDGLNDVFGVKGHGVTEFDLKVYDRWGEMIFQSSDPNLGWDGTYKGRLAQHGVYVYEVTASNETSSKFHKKGTVTLVM